MYDLVLVQIVHAHGNLFGPVDQLLRRHLLALPEQVEQRAVRTELHDYTVARGLGAYTPGENKR